MSPDIAVVTLESIQHSPSHQQSSETTHTKLIFIHIFLVTIQIKSNQYGMLKIKLSILKSKHTMRHTTTGK